MEDKFYCEQECRSIGVLLKNMGQENSKEDGKTTWAEQHVSLCYVSMHHVPDMGFPVVRKSTPLLLQSGEVS